MQDDLYFYSFVFCWSFLFNLEYPTSHSLGSTKYCKFFLKICLPRFYIYFFHLNHYEPFWCLVYFCQNIATYDWTRYNSVLYCIILHTALLMVKTVIELLVNMCRLLIQQYRHLSKKCQKNLVLCYFLPPD